MEIKVNYFEEFFCFNRIDLLCGFLPRKPIEFCEYCKNIGDECDLCCEFSIPLIT